MRTSGTITAMANGDTGRCRWRRPSHAHVRHDYCSGEVTVRGASGRRVSGRSGQATVEFALLMPFFALMLLAVVQVGLLVRTRVLVTHAAREAVRSAAVGTSDGEVRSAAVGAADLDPARLAVAVRRTGGQATVQLLYNAPTDVPLVGSLVGDVVLEARATMRLE